MENSSKESPQDINKIIEDKRAHVNALLSSSHDLMIRADKIYDQFIFKEAHAMYIESIEGYMQLMKITADDANF
jgi:hypothetical protein